MSGNKALLMSVLVWLACVCLYLIFGREVYHGAMGAVSGWALYWFFRHWGDKPSTPV